MHLHQLAARRALKPLIMAVGNTVVVGASSGEDTDEQMRRTRKPSAKARQNGASPFQASSSVSVLKALKAKRFAICVSCDLYMPCGQLTPHRRKTIPATPLAIRLRVLVEMIQRMGNPLKTSLPACRVRQTREGDNHSTIPPHASAITRPLRCDPFLI